MFHVRLAREPEPVAAATVEEFLRHRVRRLISEFHELFDKVIAELIAEGKSDPKVLQELYDQHIGVCGAPTPSLRLKRANEAAN
jgi:hypothetical protein